MSLSLRDQLLQAGLISQKQAKQASQQHNQQRREHKHNPGAAAAAAAAAEKKKLEEQRAAEAKAARDLELNRKQQEKADMKARHAQIRQLVQQNALPKVEGDLLYNFVDGTRIRRIPVTPAMREQLGRGALAVVRCEGRYHVVPAETAERIKERDARSVIPTNEAPASAAPAADDPYKDYVVPDDLMW